MILLIDNYDSFVHNLARYFERLGMETNVVRNDQIDAGTIRRKSPQAIVLSPGPCTPAEAGATINIVRELWSETPILGVCLGHQTIAAAWGGKIVRGANPMHGRTSPITHDGTGLFAGVPSPTVVCRYHSLIVEETSLPAELHVTARADDGTIMALAHAERPLFGVQFHPESILTELGFLILANFLKLAGCTISSNVAGLAGDELRQPAAPSFKAPTAPVTF